MSTNPPPGGYPQPEYAQGYSAPGSQPPYQQSPYQQPGHDQQPGYDQGGWAQPGVAQQPGYDQAPYGQSADASAWGYAPAAPPKRSHTLRNVLLVLTAVVLVGGGVIAYLALNVAKTVGANKLAPPASFQTYTRQDDNPNLATVQSSAQSLVTSAHLTPSVAIYGQSGSQTPSFLFLGGYGDTLGAQYGISDFWKGISSNQGATVSGQRDEPTGPQGGSMQCGQVHMDSLGKTVPVCVWADNSGFGAIMDYSRADSADLSGSAAMTLAFRQAAEVKK
jgi:hypothetical protein